MYFFHSLIWLWDLQSLLWHVGSLVVLLELFSYSTWDLYPQPGVEPRPPELGTQSLSPWITREVPRAALTWGDSYRTGHCQVMWALLGCLRFRRLRKKRRKNKREEAKRILMRRERSPVVQTTPGKQSEIKSCRDFPSSPMV